MKSTDLEVEYRPVEALIPYARNARTHSEEQVAQIAASMKEFGWTNPVLVDGDNGIIAGHGRVMAARKLGIEQVPCIELSHLSDAQRRAYILADNKLAENAGWDKDALGLELADLQGEGFDLGTIGFDGDELDGLLNGEDYADDPNGHGSEVIDDTYSRKIESPIYEPTGPCPSVSQLYDPSKSEELKAEIEGSDLDQAMKDFLIAAAERHTRINFDKVAEFYAHADGQTQRLMERSALVIIDFERAIEYGFITATERLEDIVGSGESYRDDD